MQDKEKDDSIRIRVSATLKEEFQQTCKKKAINGSELLRQLITEWLQAQK